MSNDEIRLPDRLSEMILWFVEDAQAIENTPGYELDMMEWHSLSPGRAVCFVCFAGAIIARRFNVGKRTVSPDDFSVENENKLRAVDWVRKGCVAEALWLMDKERMAEFSSRDSRDEEGLDMFDRLKLKILSDFDTSTHRASWPTYNDVAYSLERVGL